MDAPRTNATGTGATNTENFAARLQAISRILQIPGYKLREDFGVTKEIFTGWIKHRLRPDAASIEKLDHICAKYGITFKGNIPIPSAPAKSFAEELINVRAQSGMAWRESSVAAGISRTALKAYTTGQSLPSQDTLDKFFLFCETHNLAVSGKYPDILQSQEDATAQKRKHTKLCRVLKHFELITASNRRQSWNLQLLANK
jgi:transcriptional regulator with XRE-family HTH domain